ASCPIRRRPPAFGRMMQGRALAVPRGTSYRPRNAPPERNITMIPARAYAVQGPEDRFAPFAFERRDPAPNDVAIAIRRCGASHSDLHTARAERGGTK